MMRVNQTRDKSAPPLPHVGAAVKI